MNLGRAIVLTDYARTRGWTRGAELGLWDGRTLAYLLAHVPRLSMLGVDVFCDIGIPEYRDGAWDHAGNRAAVRAIEAAYGDRVRILEGRTVEMAAHVQEASLDFVFIDADHCFESVVEDLAAWRPKLRDGGVMMGHDIDWPSVQRAVSRTYPQYQVEADNVWVAA